jgi:hypothetical protein
MILYKDNLKTGKYEIEPEELAEQFLNSESQALENVKYGWPVTRGLNVFIASNLNSAYPLEPPEKGNKEDFEKARQIIANKIEYYEPPEPIEPNCHRPDGSIIEPDETDAPHYF